MNSEGVVKETEDWSHSIEEKQFLVFGIWTEARKFLNIWTEARKWKVQVGKIQKEIKELISFSSFGK